MKKSYKILVGNPEGKNSLGRLRPRREDTINMYLKQVVLRVWTRFIWLRIGSSDGLLCTRTFAFH
jgi:hypothetical protein